MSIHVHILINVIVNPWKSLLLSNTLWDWHSHYFSVLSIIIIQTVEALISGCPQDAKKMSITGVSQLPVSK